MTILARIARLSAERRLVVAASLAAASMFLTSEAEAQRRRLVSTPPPQTNTAYTEGGYADRTSVVQGGAISFHVASAVSPVDITITNRATDKVYTTLKGVATAVRDCTERNVRGCGWPVSATLQVGAAWESGMYAATFATSQGTRRIMFAVRSASPGSFASTLIVSPVNTYQAYNSYGGKNVYPTGSPARGVKVSFDRPYLDGGGLSRLREWEQPLMWWMVDQRLKYEYATDADLEDSTLLPRYKLVVFVGHHEYWTATARANVEAFSAMGGHIAVLGGNTMWWQVRYEDNARTMVVYKDPLIDPERTRNPGVVTTNWYSSPVFKPENLLLGTSFRSGGFVNTPSNDDHDDDDDEEIPLEKRTPFTIRDSSNWLFAGSNAQAGQTFGALAAGTEVDGALYNCTQSGLVVEGSDGTPLNYHIVATIPASYGSGTVGYYVNSAGGVVFNAASRNWAQALATDPVVATITKNVMTRLSTGEHFPYDPVASVARTTELFNCPAHPARFLVGWLSTRGGATLSSRCGYEGPAGLELTGAATAFVRNFAPTNVGLGRAEARLYLNADSVSRPAGTQFTLATLQTRVHEGAAQLIRPFLQLQLGDSSGTRALRIVQLRNDKSAEAVSSWVMLPSGWQEVRVSWTSPGTVRLQVGTSLSTTIVNSSTGQAATELVLSTPDLSSSGYVCVDALAVGEQEQGSLPALRW